MIECMHLECRRKNRRTTLSLISLSKTSALSHLLPMRRVQGAIENQKESRKIVYRKCRLD